MSEKFSLKWNDFQSNVSRTFSQLLFHPLDERTTAQMRRASCSHSWAGARTRVHCPEPCQPSVLLSTIAAPFPM